jgi:V/A-type H+-transporting ATPase subunit D
MAQIAMTRMALLETRARLAVAASGVRLLRGKREVLASELFQLARDAIAGRERLDRALLEAARALVVARAREEHEVLDALAVASGRDVAVEVSQRRVWGVPVAEVSAPSLLRGADARGAAPATWGLTAAEAAARHEAALDVLVQIASRELLLVRLGEEIQETSRRINALEQLVLPRLEQDAARVSRALDERAREDSLRLKRLRRRTRG